LQQIVAIEYYALLITGIIWVWIITVGNKNTPHFVYIVYWIPLVLVVFLMIKRNFLERHIFVIAEYIKKIEVECIGDDEIKNGYGWDHREP
jgi:hypothetical protein